VFSREVGHKNVQNLLSPRAIRPAHEITAFAAFLLSPDATYAAGATIDASGVMSFWWPAAH
jgi:hypothetical protein